MTVEPVEEDSAMKSRSLWQAIVGQLPHRARQRAALRLGRLLKRPLPAMIDGFRLTLDLREGIQRSIFLGEYEPEQTGWIRECVRPGDVVLDVGSNCGYYTFLASKLVGPTGMVFAFEPSPSASEAIARAVHTNDLRNITLTRAAVGSEAGTATLFVDPTGDLHSPSLLPMDFGFVRLEVPVIRLDDFEPLKGETAIRLMKIDVEGYEPNVLTGMDKIIRARRVENVFCEFNSGWLARNNTTIQQLQDRFAALGYHVYRQTTFHRDIEGSDGTRYDMVDVWYRL